MKTNRKKKLFFITALAIIYLVIAVNFHKIRFALSMYRIYSQEKKIESVVDDVGNVKPIVDNPLQDIVINEGNVDKGDNSVDNKDSPVDKSEDKVTLPDKKPSDNSKKPSNDSKKSYISILTDFNITLEELRIQFQSDLDNLITQGIEDYGNGGMSNTQLASKYLSAGSKLEKSSDAKFNEIVKAMEKELKANGHDTSIVKEIKEYYISFKDAKKTDLINRGMKHM